MITSHSANQHCGNTGTDLDSPVLPVLNTDFMTTAQKRQNRILGDNPEEVEQLRGGHFGDRSNKGATVSSWYHA